MDTSSQKYGEKTKDNSVFDGTKSYKTSSIKITQKSDSLLVILGNAIQYSWYWIKLIVENFVS